MPVENYSVVQPSTQQKTFTENNICRFSLPFNVIPFFDPHESYLQVNMKSSFDMKMRLNGTSSVIIKYIRLSCNGQVLEEIDEFNQLAHLYNDYGNDDSSRNFNAVFNNDGSSLNAGKLMGNQGGTLADGVKAVKLIIPMKECGLFSDLNVIPLMALGNNLDVEIRFAPDKEVVKVDTINVTDNNNPTGGSTVIKLINDGAVGDMFGSDADPFVVKLPYKGFTCVGDIPLQVGDHIGIFPDAGGGAVTGMGDMTITEIRREATTSLDDEPNQIEIVCGAGVALGAIVNANTLHLQLHKSVANADGPVGSIEYSNVEWYIQKVIPPAVYVENLKKKLNSPEGFTLDINTWTTYKSNLLQGVQSQTVEIPAYQSRAKAVLVIPRIQNQAVAWNKDNALATSSYNFNGQFDNLLDYQFQVNNGLRVPTRPVNLEVMNGTFKHLSAEHLIQITQAVSSSNIGVRNIKNARNNFIIGRQLSKYGGTTNLNSAMRVYLNYDDATKPTNGLQVITLINHINRLSINAQGLQVFT
tara:strand:+ start:4446 stop:6026 length:1581 start_codon:yes stop_codon:yes gene_type:complete